MIVKSNFPTVRYSDKCKESIAKNNAEDYVFNGRMIATPIIGVLGLFTAPYFSSQCIIRCER